MTILREALEALKSVLFLQEEVKRLGNNTAKMAEHLQEMRLSTTRIEAQQKDAVQIATQAAQLAVAGELNAIRDRLSKIEMYLANSTRPPSAPELLLSQDKRSDDGTSRGQG